MGEGPSSGLGVGKDRVGPYGHPGQDSRLPEFRAGKRPSGNGRDGAKARLYRKKPLSSPAVARGDSGHHPLPIPRWGRGRPECRGRPADRQSLVGSPGPAQGEEVPSDAPDLSEVSGVGKEVGYEGVPPRPVPASGPRLARAFRTRRFQPVGVGTDWGCGSTGSWDVSGSGSR